MSSSGSKAKLLLIVVVISLLGLLVILDGRRRDAEEELRQLTVRLEQLQTGNAQQNQEIAKQVVAKIRTHLDIPMDVEPTVATIVDVEKLKERNPFYEKAKNGDYLVVTPTRAILYDAQKDMILDVIPVQIQQAAGSGAARQGEDDAVSSRAAMVRSSAAASVRR